MQNVFVMQYSESKEELSKPIADDFFAQSLVVFPHEFEIGGKVALCIGICLHSQYSMIIISSFSIRKNSSYPTMKGTLFFLISSFSLYKI